MNIDIFFIEETEIDSAKKACGNIKNGEVRSRATANALAVCIAKKYFTDFEIDIESGLHKIPQIAEKIDIADIYINGSFIDIRLCFDSETIKIPKQNYNNGLIPKAHMVLKIDNEFTNATVMGFITTDIVSEQENDDNYFYIKEEALVSFYDIQTIISSNYEKDIPENLEELIYNYLDNKLDDTNILFNTLINSKHSRVLFNDIASVQNILESIVLDSKGNTVSETTEGKDDTLDLDITQNELESTNESFELLPEDYEDENLEFSKTKTLEEYNLTNEIALEDTVEDIVNIEDDLAIDSGSEGLEIEDLSLNEDLETVSLDENFSTSITPSLSSIENDDEFTESFELSSENENEEFIDEIEPISETLDDMELKESEAEEVIIEEEPTTGLDNEDNDEIIQIDIESDNEDDIINVDIEPNKEEQVYEEIIENEEIEERISSDEIIDLEQDESSVAEETIIEVSDEEENEYKIVNENNDIDENYETYSEDNTDSEQKAAEIDDLFNNDSSESNETIDEYVTEALPKKNLKVVPLIGVLAFCAALGYFGYTKFANTNQVAENNNIPIPTTSNTTPPKANNAQKEEHLMPVETVENIKEIKPTNEGTAISIPAIEQDLNASINVANLAVKWEVPSTYVSNSTASKYFTKIGKIIQLNLKTEMLLLNKPPITNKIMVELEFNKNNSKFDIKTMLTSSGEQVVDNLIVKTVKSTLDLNLKTNMSVFNNLQGNPVLIIRL